MKLNGYVELKKGAWSPEEDEKLIAYIKKHGIKINWSQMPKAAGLSRSGKSCRLRWVNYLKPDLRRGRLTMEEIKTIIELHDSLGNKWSQIAAQLPGRTDNEIKNFWHTYMRKCFKTVRATNACKIKRTKRKEKNVAEEDSSLFSYVAEELYSKGLSTIAESTEFPIAESYSPSKDFFVTNEELIESMENIISSSESSHGEIHHQAENFFAEPFDVCIPESNSTIFDEPGCAYPAHESMSCAYPAHESMSPGSTHASNNDELSRFWFDIFMEAKRL